MKLWVFCSCFQLLFRLVWERGTQSGLWEKGDWFEGGLDKEPHFRTGPKSHIWKCTYHTTRALTNCITMLGVGKEQRRKEMEEFIGHWRKTARALEAKEY